MRIDSSGNVGIGTSSPSNKIDVYSTDSSNARVRIGGTTNLVTHQLNNTGGDFYFAIDNSSGSALTGVSYGRVLYSTGAYPMMFYTNSSVRMLIDSGGNVGIGTASPNSNGGASARVLHINSPNSSDWAITHYTNGSTGASASDGVIVGNIGLDFYIFNYEASPLIFATSSSERMRINSSGDLLVGTTTTDIWTGSATNTGFRVETNGTITAARSGFAAILAKRTTSDGNVCEFARGTAQVGSISVTGSNTSFNTSSDYRLKESIAPMTGALAVVGQLKPCTYVWKSTGEASQGFIAHELAEVMPDCVTGEKDAVDAEGKPVYQGIDTSFLVATLTAAIQELKAEVDSLKAQISQ